MSQFHHWSWSDIDDMMPWERDMVIILLEQHIEEENNKKKSQQSQIADII